MVFLRKYLSKYLAVAVLLVAGGAPRSPSAHAGSPACGLSAMGWQAPSASPFQSLTAIVAEKMREYRIPGVALGVLRDGVVEARGLGVTNVEDPQPVTPDTIFPIASISKTFTATAMMRLVEQGKVDLRAPVRRYLPEFRVQDEAASRDVTIWHLLTHTSGWEGQISAANRGDETLARFVGELSTNMQLAPPGAAWSYNNAGFTVAGRVIEVVTGQSIGAALRDLVFQPLGLSHAFTSPGDVVTYRFALGHRSPGDGPPTVSRPYNLPANVTAGGIAMSLTDLLAYARFHLGDGSGASGARILTRQTLELMRTAQLRKQSTDDDMGIGWHLRTVGAVHTAAHGGTLDGHILLVELVPERRFALAILTNAQSGWRLIQDVERAALRTYFGAGFETNQAVAHRGLFETLPQFEPLVEQPDLRPYVGRYVRPMEEATVAIDKGRLVVREQFRGEDPAPPREAAFYGADRAVVIDGSRRGESIEFVRGTDGRVDWIRIVGRIARRVDDAR